MGVSPAPRKTQKKNNWGEKNRNVFFAFFSARGAKKNKKKCFSGLHPRGPSKGGGGQKKKVVAGARGPVERGHRLFLKRGGNFRFFIFPAKKGSGGGGGAGGGVKHFFLRVFGHNKKKKKKNGPPRAKKFSGGGGGRWDFWGTSGLVLGLGGYSYKIKNKKKITEKR